MATSTGVDGSAGRGAAVVVAHLGVDLKAEFKEWCKERQLTPSNVVRDVVRLLLGGLLADARGGSALFEPDQSGRDPTELPSSAQSLEGSRDGEAANSPANLFEAGSAGQELADSPVDALPAPRAAIPPAKTAVDSKRRGLSLQSIGRLVPRPDVGAKVRTQQLLTPSEARALAKVAAAEGYTPSEFMIAALRAAVANAAEYGQWELEALTASNLRLMQWLDESRDARQAGSTTAEDRERLLQSEAMVREHIETASRTMAAGVRRWQIKI